MPVPAMEASPEGAEVPKSSKGKKRHKVEEDDESQAASPMPAAPSRASSEGGDAAADKGAIGQCERHPDCIRGYKHSGLGGRCHLPKLAKSGDVSTAAVGSSSASRAPPPAPPQRVLPLLSTQLAQRPKRLVPVDDDSVQTCTICFDIKQLLLCSGERDANGTVPAETGHTVCEPCLVEWFRSRNELRAASGLRTVARPSCPVCKADLRGASLRSEDHCLGLPKVKGTW